MPLESSLTEQVMMDWCWTEMVNVQCKNGSGEVVGGEEKHLVCVLP